MGTDDQKMPAKRTLSSELLNIAPFLSPRLTHAAMPSTYML